MSPTRRRAVAVLLSAVTASAVAHYMTPSKHMADVLGKPDLEKIFPAAFADWTVDPFARIVQPSPETQALLNSIYNQTLTRTYINSNGRRIMLSVAYGGDQSDATRAHMPEVCYPAQGFQILSNFTGQLVLSDRAVPTRYLMAKQGNRNEPITYWMVVGDRATVSRLDQKIAQFELGLQGLIPDGMLVRVSSIDADMKRGHDLQAAFLKDLADALPTEFRNRVLGRGI
ncbi:EpsI family protein [Curvibacter sp. CHRR-16]|uniref:exosortase-associated protein EpsI, B-type n=1 Tax=Curvibacter sp. CHRR-16 TaxID=2835872 RepID=UPI001BD9CDF4|nr:exosortase-associated protein EpsI, B-type [Curvibacter sp. CHRR-16]MBT0571516.1 EpsI family protein [Curvibacter sp. CHRR-16]